MAHMDPETAMSEIRSAAVGTRGSRGGFPWARREAGRAVAIAAILVVTGAGLAGARVFRLLGGEGGAVSPRDPPGWATVHRAELVLNGAPATVTVAGVSLPLQEAMGWWQASMEREGAHAATATGQRLAWGLAVTGDRVIRVLGLSPEGPRECVMVRLEQTKADFVRSQRTAGTGVVDPDWPGASVRWSVADPSGGLEMRIVESHDDRNAMLSAIWRSLISQGWRPALGDIAGGPFLRGDEIGLVHVREETSPGRPPRALIMRQRMRD